MILAGTAIYIVGFFVSIFLDTVENVKWYNDSFLGFGLETHDNRPANTKDAWMAVIWPIILSLFLLKGIIFLINKFIGILLLLIGVKYNRSKIYEDIETWCYK